MGFEFDGTYLYVGGRAPERTRKFLNVKAGQVKVVLVVDDLVSTDPWTPRFLRSTARPSWPSGRAGSDPARTFESPRRSRGAGTWTAARTAMTPWRPARAGPCTGRER